MSVTIAAVVALAGLALVAGATGIAGDGLIRMSPDESPSLALGTEKLTHLHFFFHDIVSGSNPTAMRIVSPPRAGSPTSFGLVTVMDDPLTDGADPSSRAVGHAQGMYVSSSLTEIGFLQAMNLVMSDFNDSVVTVLGRNPVTASGREMPVVGGSGAFRFARGYALARTHSFDAGSGDAVVEYDVYVLHR